MKLTVKGTIKETIKADGLIIPIFDDKVLSGLQNDLDKRLVNSIKNHLKEKSVSLKKGQISAFLPIEKLPYKKIILIGLGQKKSYQADTFRQVAGAIARQAKTNHLSTVHIVLPKTIDLNHISQALSEGIVMGGYEFEKYSKEKNDKNNKKIALKEIVLSHGDIENEKSSHSKAFTQGISIGDAVNYARDLSNTPANFLTPKEMVKRAKAIFANSPVKVEVIDEKKAKALKMGSFLSVGEGSIHDSYMLVLRYTPIPKKPSLALVGKGVTFDSGGISIKPSKGMNQMKADMGGAAAVFGAMKAISQIKPTKNILAVIPLSENMPSATATRPGDVITAMNGKTIEVLNTDAEGRLILADAICYAVTQKVSHIIDIATLTGACLVALGNEASALFTNDDSLREGLTSAATFTGDRLWEMPLYEEYLDLLKSDVADLSNCFEGRLGGTCTAAKFLEQFTKDTPWAHIDMASVMHDSKTSGYRVKGMSGSGVRNFVEFVLSAKL